MRLEERLNRRIREWRRMADAYREAEKECDQRLQEAFLDDDQKRANEELQEAMLNKASADAFERCANDLRADLSAQATENANGKRAHV